MGRRIEPQTLLTRFADIERRLTALERSGRLSTQTQAQSSTDDDFQGIVFQTYNIADRHYRQIEMGDAGLHLPAIPIPMAKSNDFATVTSSSFVRVLESDYYQATTDAFRINVTWATDAATTGEVRVLNHVLGGATSDAASLAAGTSDVAQFAWLHQQTITFSTIRFAVEARRTAGTGNVYIFTTHGYMVAGKQIAATEGGVVGA